MSLASGQTIGKYVLGKKIGQGGFGFVFIARDTGLDRDVALKFLHPEHTANNEILQRFFQEARSAARIAHPGIVTVHELGSVTGTGTTADGTAFIAMELLDGESLTDRLERSGRLAPDAAMEVCRQVASALEAAHDAGIIHRDLKPDNVFLVEDPAIPAGERIKVLDFGIAKLAHTTERKSVQTASMVVFGTPRYMSPEQCRSAGQIDHRSDIYTLGCILFELVTGRTPFDGESGELIAMHQLVPAPAASSRVADLPPALDALIAAMLAKEPARRPQSMAAVQRALEAGGALAIGPEPTLPPTGIAPRRHDAPTPVFGRRKPSLPTVAKPPAASPTTLSGASGAAMAEPRRGSRAMYATIAIGVAGAIAATIGLATRGGTAPVSTPVAPAAQIAPRDATPLPPVDAAPPLIDATPRDAAVAVPPPHRPPLTGPLPPPTPPPPPPPPPTPIDPTCAASQHLVDHRCVANPPCGPVKDRTVDPFEKTPCPQ